MSTEENNSKIRRGFSLIELLVVLAIIAILVAAAIPMLRSGLVGASETTVMREVQAIHQAQVQYQSQFGDYASTLSQLGPPQNRAVGPDGAKLIPASLASGEKNGYVFTLLKTPGGFLVHANPKVFGKDGHRTFYIDEDGVLHQNWGPEPATSASPELK